MNLIWMLTALVLAAGADVGATATRGGYVPAPGRWQVVVGFDAVDVGEVEGWDAFSGNLAAAPFDFATQVTIRDELRAMFAGAPVDIVTSPNPPTTAAPRQLVVHVVGPQPEWCWRCSGVAFTDGATEGRQHAFVFTAGSLARADVVACIAAHELGHLFGLDHTGDGSVMDAPPPLPCPANVSNMVYDVAS